MNVEGKCGSDTKCDISSVGRAIPCQGIGHRFEPDMSLQFQTVTVLKCKCDISSVGRAIPCQGIGHRFEPDMSLQFFSSVSP